MSSCEVCLRSVSSKQVKITCSDCAKVFHGGCVNLNKTDIECLTADGLPWRCATCSEDRRKSMRFESQATEGNLTLEDVMKKILEVLENNKDIEKNVNKSCEALSEKLEENTKVIREQTAALDKCLGIIDDLTRKNKALEEKVNSLEARVEDMEQYSRRNAVEIHGIPQEKNEDVLEIVKEVGKALDVDITDSMIDVCHRLGKSFGPQNRPPGIIVKFVRRMDKETLMKKRRVKSNLSTRHMNRGTDIPVYVNEALTPARRRLFAAARQVKKDKHFKYLWIRNGNIFLRKEDLAPVVKVTCQADLSNL